MRHPLNRIPTRRLALTALLLVAAVALAALPAQAFTGTLLAADLAILGTGNWIETGPTGIEWTVTQNADESWHYSYLFWHPKGETSHFILETSTSFTAGNIFNASGDFSLFDVGWQEVGSGNPNMPERVYGIRFDEAWDLNTELAFDSDRAPIWGDFYAKNGNAGGFGPNTAWNAGFTLNDSDPFAAPQDGSLDHHLLVPDTDSDLTPIPEPSAMLLLSSGLLGAWVARRRLLG